MRRHVTLHLQHHDRASLLAGKLHALLCRPYTKGRDVYDLAWYLTDRAWPEPNLELLNHAMRQTSPELPLLRPDTWRQVVACKLRGLDWDVVRGDVRPFLEDPREVDLLARDHLARLLGGAERGAGIR